MVGFNVTCSPKYDEHVNFLATMIPKRALDFTCKSKQSRLDKTRRAVIDSILSRANTDIVGCNECHLSSSTLVEASLSAPTPLDS
ncbi:hypothetical protein AXF42_Ash012085 [Apostasia shenzhenica]|uniref:Uncharacterized protein n=1 Tax=Apostasia shenzhenica TaxID=1088818 RepID=A0A2I0AJQ5_9ASPA|nr:hypothetical protein AXF42_Ash012085 [Apostasia shenzhenica]